MMNDFLKFTISMLSILLFATNAGSQSLNDTGATDYWPSATWRTSSPEQQGFNSEELAKLFDHVKENNVNINCAMIIRNGYLILEAYFYPYQKNIPHDVASVTKSITSLAAGIAIDKGYIKNVDENVLTFFRDRTAANLDENKKGLTIEHLLTMTSALCRNIDEGEEQPGHMRQSEDGIQYMLDLPCIDKPGKSFVHSSIAPHLLSAIITRTTDSNLLEFSRKNLFSTLGITSLQWPADKQGNNHGWGDLFITPYDLAKIGYLVLNGGNWAGKQIISKEWIERSSRPHVYEDAGTAYGYLWWIPMGTPGLFEGRGRGGQRLIVWPQKNLVIVLIGNGGYTLGGIGNFIARALVSDSALAENPDALRLLQSKIAMASMAPPPKPLAPLPLLADQISGKKYLLDDNPLGMQSFTLDFKHSDAATIIISSVNNFSKERFQKTIPMGLDDVYRMSNTSDYGLPAGAKGTWVSEKDFDFLYNEPANNRLFRFRLHFDAKTVGATVTERTGLIDELTIKGKMLQ